MDVRFGVDDRGRSVCEKRAQDTREAARLRREADLLDVAAHPGLVELLGFDDTAEPCLTTVRIEGTTLASDKVLEPEEIAGVLAALASTVADLHAMGLVHGAVCPDHVLLDEDGRPVLCSLGYGGLAGERQPAAPVLPAPFFEPSPQEDDDGLLDQAVDVYGLGALLHTLLSPAEGRGRRAAVDGLRRLAAHAMAPARADRPDARELAAALHDAVPAARLPRLAIQAAMPRSDPVAGGPSERPLERWRTAQSEPRFARSRLRAPARAPSVRPHGGRRRWGRAVLGTTAVAGLGSLALLLSLGRAPRGEPTDLAEAPAPAPASLPPASVSTTTGGRHAEPVWSEAVRAGCALVEGSLSADVDADGCAELVLYSDGVLRAGDRAWAVGQPGDVAAVGDWTCAGSRALALLRPATGEVFAFERWATSDLDAVAPVVARVGGARGVRAADLDGDGCHELAVERVTGAPVIVRVPPRP